MPEWRGENSDWQDHVIVIEESLARVIAASRITSVCWLSYLPPKTQKLVLIAPATRSFCCDSNRAIGVHTRNIRSTCNRGMAGKS